MSAICPLLVPKTIKSCEKHKIVNWRNLAYLCGLREVGESWNKRSNTFKSCHSDQTQNRCKPCKRLDTAVFLYFGLQFKLHFCSRNAVKSHGFPKKSHEKITRIGCGSEPNYTKQKAGRAVCSPAFLTFI